MRRGLWIAVCAMVLCACGCGADTDKTADKTQGTSGEQEAFSPIAAKDVSKVDTEAEYPYEIKVNRKDNCITIYGVDDTGCYSVPVRSMICSVGKDAPSGTFQLGSTSRWQMDADDTFSQYATRIVNEVVFHSAPYYSMNNQDLDVEQFNQMGTTVDGCSIRLEVADAKWIAGNCPEGTKVEICEEKKDSPLGKPQARKLKEDEKADPTDDGKKTEKSVQYVPVVFSGVENTSVMLNGDCNLLDGVTACDKEKNDLTAYIQVFGKVDVTTPGVYKVAYLCSNEEKETRIIEREIEVTQQEADSQEQGDRETQQPQQQSTTVFAYADSPASSPEAAPTPEPEPTPTPEPAQEAVPTAEPQTTAVSDSEPAQVYVFERDVTPPQINIVAETRYTPDLNDETLRKRVRISDDSGVVESLYVTVQPLRQSEYYVVIYEAVDESDNRTCVSEMVKLRPETVFKNEK